MSNTQEQIDIINIKINDINLKILENQVNIQGNRQVAEEARESAFRAVYEAHEAYEKANQYTDTKIASLRTELNTNIFNTGESSTEASKDYADDKIKDSDEKFRNDWYGWYQDLDQTVKDGIQSVEEINEWVDNTINEELPLIKSEIQTAIDDNINTANELREESLLSRQEITEMSSRWRSIGDEIERTKEKVLEMDYSVYERTTEIYNNISVEYEGRFAGFESKITVAAGEIGAVADRVDTLNVKHGELEAEVQTLERAMIEGDEALANQIVSLSVGTNTQFDPLKIWHYDSDAEGWTNAVWEDGYIRQANSNALKVDIRNLALDNQKYRQIRMRIKKDPDAVFVGRLSYIYINENTPNLVTFDEPTILDGFGEITLNLDWSKRVKEIYLTLFDWDNSPTGSYVYLDWFTIGRPAPGASTASLNQEIQARIDGDSANARRIDVIDTQFNSLDGKVTAQGRAISGIQSEISDLEDQFTTTNSAITDLSSRIDTVDGKTTVNSQAITGINNKITIIDGNIDSISNQITDLNAEIEDKASSSALSSLTSRVTDNEEGISSLGSRIDSLNNEIENIGSNEVIQGINSRLNAHDGRITSNTNSITSINQDITTLNDSKASNTAVDNLTSRVTANEDSITVLNSSTTSLRSDLTSTTNATNKAQRDAEEAQALAGTKGKVIIQNAEPSVSDRYERNLWINTTGGANTPMRWDGSAWSEVTDKAAKDAQRAANDALRILPDKASVTSVNNLTTRVSEAEGRINANGQAITSIKSEINKGSEYTDYFNYKDNTELKDVGNWIRLAGVQAEIWQSFVGWEPTGMGKNLRAGDLGVSSYSLMMKKTDTVYEPDVVYKITARIRRHTGTSRSIIGIRCFDKDDVYVRAVTLISTDTTINQNRWETVTAFFSTSGKRTSSLGSTLEDPTKVVRDFAYFNVQIGLNYDQSQQGRTVVDYVTLEMVSDASGQAEAITKLESDVSLIDGQVTSMASAITSISAGSGTDLNSALFRMQTVSGISGYSRISMEARASKSSVWKAAGMTIHVPSNTARPSQIVMKSDQFFITGDNEDNETGIISPFYISDGMTYIDNAVIKDGDIHANLLTIDGRLELKDRNSGFSLGKKSLNDPEVGMYIGVGDTRDSFGVNIGRHDSKGYQQLRMTKELGLKLVNPSVFQTSTVDIDSVIYSTNGTYNLKKQVVDISLVGGGRAGRDGGVGTATIVRLYDGTVLKNTWRSEGATHRSPTMSGQDSILGKGGLGGRQPPSSDGGFGAGGGVLKRSVGGGASQGVIINQLDLSGYTDPKLQITCGVGGHPGTWTGRGGHGACQVTYTAVGSEIPVYSLPTIPTNEGIFQTTGGYGNSIFPNLVRGLWVIDAVDDGVLSFRSYWGGELINIVGPISNFVFLAEIRPVVAASPGNGRNPASFKYRFYKMGN